ncbi:MAG TPA: YaiO family outer membrane beta-barrel protein [Bacteroidia bacterium]
MKNIIRLNILIVFMVFGTLKTNGQNADSLYNAAQQKAYNKDYRVAKKLCKQAIDINPANTDYSILLGRIYAWEGSADSAKVILNKIIKDNNKNTEAYDALTDVELWSGEYQAVISDCDLVLSFLPENKKDPFWIKQAKAYEALEDYTNARRVLLLTLQNKKDNYEGEKLLEYIIIKAYKNSISVSYLNVSFTNPSFSPWNFGFVEYQRKFKKCPVLGRINYGDAYGNQALHFEIDAYPKFSKQTYAYLNAGLSNSSQVFPSYRASAEIYQKLPKGFELSAGGRYLGFENEDIFIYTAYLGYYYKNLWFAYRPYIVTKNSDTFVSHTALLRKYFASEDNYINLEFIYGATPYTTFSYADIVKVNSQRVGMSAQYKLGKSFLIRPMFSYEYEEYFPSLYRNRFYSELTLVKRF